jgi:hypothetical protein
MVWLGQDPVLVQQCNKEVVEIDSHEFEYQCRMLKLASGNFHSILETVKQLEIHQPHSF